MKEKASFQFHIVRLKELSQKDIFDSIMFQFHIVRLKDIRHKFHNPHQ